MGTELLKFAGFFEKNELLKDFSCSRCRQAITEADINHQNYQLWVSDYANEITKEFCGSGPVYGVSF
jgi:hypothetical protein